MAEISYEEFSAFLMLKKSELRTLTDSRSIGDAMIKYFVFNGKDYLDTLEIRDYGNISLLKSEEKIKICCGLEICECKIKEIEPI